MRTNNAYDVVVVGGGPAGMAAALAAARAFTSNRDAGGGSNSDGISADGASSVDGARSRVLIIERNDQLGGILPQCIHNGFGSVTFGSDLPGPEYAYRYRKEVEKEPIDVLLDTAVIDLHADRSMFIMNSRDGYINLHPRSVVLAMGCRERTRAQIWLPGARSAGVFTAGTVQRLVNIEGYVPGRRVVILGSGDIGMIMARRLAIEGAEVVGVYELLPHLTGLRRNYVQCLQDWDIPLHLSTTVTNIIGNGRVEAVEVCGVDADLKPIPETRKIVACDTLLLSVGLIPENELSRGAGIVLDRTSGGPVVDDRMETSVPGIFAAGNVTGIYDLVDYVSKAGEIAGRGAANYAMGITDRCVESDSHPGAASESKRTLRLKPGAGAGAIIPQILHTDQDGTILCVRPRTLAERRVRVSIREDGREVFGFAEKYARPAEMIVRTLDRRAMDAVGRASSAELEVVIE